MNKHLTGLVAVAAVVSVTASSIPAEAKVATAEEIKTIIEDTLKDFVVTNQTTSDDVEAKYKDAISGYENITTEPYIWIEKKATKTTTGSAVINVDIANKSQTTPDSAWVSIDKDIAVLTPDQAVEDAKKSLAKAKYEVVDSIDSMDIKNETTPGAVLIRINDSLSDLGVTAQFKEFTITPSTTNSEGNLYSKVELSKDGNSTEVRYKKYIDEVDDTNQTMAELAKVIENRMEHLNVNNDYTSENILNRLKHSVENPNLYLTLDNLDITKSTLDTEGKANGTIVIHKDGSTETQSVSFNIVIDKELTDEDEELINDIDDILSDYSYTKYKGSNNTTADQIKSEIENGLSDENIRVAVSDFELDAATDDEWGYIDCKITLTRADNSVVTCNGWVDIYPLSCSDTTSNDSSGNSGNSGSSSGSSSSHHHSSGSSSSSSNSSSSSSSSNSNSTAATGAANSANGTVSDSSKPVSLANMSKEAVKAVEAKVVNSISAVTGATAGEAKELVTTDGAKLSVTPIAKDGKSVGAVITAEAASAKAVIPVDKNQAPVTAVYKYVPLLDKYIQVQNAVITTDAITLPVQANATYVASPTVMPEVATIKQGWVQANNNWYMVNVTGDPLTGWQKDNTGWTYMSPSTGAMQTGWAQVGGSWYYLKNNGYMSTGWVQDGNTWYYCNADGSMASNTTIDGYTLGSNGAWIR